MRTVRWTLVVVLVLLALAWLVRRVERPGVPRGAALVIPLEGEYVEAPEAPFFAQVLGMRRHSLVSMLSQLRKAELDTRIAHVVLEIGDLQIGWGKAQELRDAITALRQAGRHPVALLSVNGFGANLEYYVASAAEKVYLEPGGGPPLVGLAQEFLFLGGLWKKLDVPMVVAQAGKYKGAAESISDEGMSDAFREQAESLLDSVDDQFVTGIAEARGVSTGAVRAAFEAASSNPETLQKLSLVDGASTRAELLEALGNPPEVDADAYAGVDPGSVGFSPVASLALVYVSGPITTGKGATSRTGSPIAAADTVIDALEQAAEDDSMRAIVLRVDSPGGGSFPSELIWRAIRAARERKPVVASFSDYAASGGYYLSSAVDAIVSQPATLTGSIGVFAVRPAIGPLLDRLDIHSAVLQRAPHAELNLMTPPLSPDTVEWLQRDVHHVYDTFLSRVSEGRHLEVAKVADVAQGHVWTGAQALERGLVDQIGGLRAAVEEAKRRAGIASDADVDLHVFPPPRPLAEQIAEAFQTRIAESASAALPWAPERWQAGWGRTAGWLAALSAGGTALVPPFWVEIH